MTETPEQRVARLQSQLASAKVDELQAELAAARAGTGGVPAPAPDGTAASQFAPGQAFQFAPGQTIQIGPGQTIQLGTGQTVRFRHGQAGFSMDGSGGNVQAADTRLAPAPREVPLGYRALLFPFSFWTVFALFMVTVTPIALYLQIPLAGAAVAGLTLLVVGAKLLRKSVVRNSLLRWGEMATVINAEVLSRGTYYSGTTVSNVRMAQAQGWQVTRQWYSGPITKTRVTYELRGTQASIVVRGLDYEQGVILADSRKPARALCVSSFPFDLGRDPAGNWTGAVGARAKLGSVAMLAVLLGWTAGMCVLWGSRAAHLHGLVR